jgi:hypothetical protein
MYDFGGFVVSKLGSTLTLEGTFSQPEDITTSAGSNKNKVEFMVTGRTKIVKLVTENGKNEQQFIDLDKIKAGDHLQIKTDEIDWELGQATATDILVLPPATSENPVPVSAAGE